MHLKTIQFGGYKLLAATSCNVSGHTIALVGPNEAGKSSVLNGLMWLESDPSGPLARAHYNRALPPADDAVVVRATYVLDGGDRAALLGLDVDSEQALDSVHEFRYSRRADGQSATGTTPELSRRTQPFLAAVDHADQVAVLFNSFLESFDAEVDPGPFDFATAMTSDARWLAERLGDEEDAGRWEGEELEDRRAVVERVVSRVEEAKGQVPFKNLLTGHRALLNRTESIFEAALIAGAKLHPHTAVRAALASRRPRFVLFRDHHRAIESSYHLGDDDVREDPDPAFVNLLVVAGTTLDSLWTTITEGTPAQQASLKRRINDTLRDRLAPIWTQTRLTVELDIERDGLVLVNVFEIDNDSDEPVTPIEERSDGLRAFLALALFVLAAGGDQPPVLLIDEAERNLHYDAQADLLRVLTNELRVAKVIYTTHSPGCLPLDLGTNIRVVERVDATRSELQNNFWTDTESGFSRLLFAMGAGAAAFSAFRKAVLAEGVSEMLLLPTMLRAATDGSELDFQVAFGLSNMPARKTVGRVALITSYLVDGDRSGEITTRQLVRAGVPRAHIFSLPSGKAIEDLIDPEQYLEVANGLIGSDGRARLRDLDRSLTIAKAFDVWASTHGLRPPGHKIVASELAALGSDLRLTRPGKAHLKKLRAGIESSFEREPYLLKETEPEDAAEDLEAHSQG